MQCEHGMQLRIAFLEALNEQLRREVAQNTRIARTRAPYWPMFLVSGLVSLSAWTLSWIS
ncbi:hypothetical protein [Rubinisphaera margarita]|uniref:hypothetical protein n=1 Tax=Rubinisphaera margarita TaxID=2909586 RepID=UPI001EE94DB1|nr:hypothetical protein [Rubinisphaera margarita]MCG6157988.1 hypothetical protein [Rubinisphaera margarita]